MSRHAWKPRPWKRAYRRAKRTHADALQASRAVMKKALTEIAFWQTGDAAQIAQKALNEQAAAYRAGVMEAVD